MATELPCLPCASYGVVFWVEIEHHPFVAQVVKAHLTLIHVGKAKINGRFTLFHGTRLTGVQPVFLEYLEGEKVRTV